MRLRVKNKIMQKEFISPRAKEYNEKSDTELIDLIATEPSAVIQETAKALLDKRLKKTIQFLIEVIQDNNEATAKYNKWIVKLTIVIAILTFLMLIGLGFQIFLVLN